MALRDSQTCFDYFIMISKLLQAFLQGQPSLDDLKKYLKDSLTLMKTDFRVNPQHHNYGNAILCISITTHKLHLDLHDTPHYLKQ